MSGISKQAPQTFLMLKGKWPIIIIIIIMLKATYLGVTFRIASNGAYFWDALSAVVWIEERFIFISPHSLPWTRCTGNQSLGSTSTT